MLKRSLQGQMILSAKVFFQSYQQAFVCKHSTTIYTYLLFNDALALFTLPQIVRFYTSKTFILSNKQIYL